MIGSSLLRYLENHRLTVWDTETESLNLFYSRPWQISYSIGTLKRIERIVTRYIRWDDLQMSAGAAEVTRFNREEYLRLAEPPEVVLADFEALLLDPNTLNAGHNLLGFDIDQHKNWRRACGKAEDWSYLPRLLDTMCFSKAYRASFPIGSNRLSWQYQLLHERLSKKKVEGEPKKGGGVSLGAMCREFGIEYDPMQAHSADYDVSRTHLLLGKLIWAIEIS